MRTIQQLKKSRLIYPMIKCYLGLPMVVAVVLYLSGCAPVGPDFVKPEVEVPDSWSAQSGDTYATDAPQLSTWWKLFNDPVLNELVDTALRNNNTLELAGLRILEARAQLGVAAGSLYPQSQFAAGEANYRSPPENTGITNNYWQYTLGASVAWEIDFWGRFRRGVESADAAYLASIEAYNQALVLLTAQVVESYTAVRAAEEQLRISQDNIELQKRSYDITEVLYRNGDSSELDVQQANTLLLSTQATVPSLEVQLIQARNALSTLLGQIPGSIETLLQDSSGISAIPAEISVGFPADMLRNRPDVRQAELEAMAQNALVGVAESGLYPSFNLNGSIGLASGSPGTSSFGDLFQADSLTYSIGPSFVWPFLNYGRIKNEIRVQDARLQQALVRYRETALQAAREAENAMASLIGTRKQASMLAETVVSAKRSAKLASLRYSEGFSDYQRVLNSLQSLFTQEQRYVVNQSAIVNSMAALFRALGGGWQGQQNRPLISQETSEVMEQRTDWGTLIEAVEVEQPENQN